MRLAGTIVDIRKCDWATVELDVGGQHIDARLGKVLVERGIPLQMEDRVVVLVGDDAQRHRNTIIYVAREPGEKLEADQPATLPASATREGLVRRGVIRPAK